MILGPYNPPQPDPWTPVVTSGVNQLDETTFEKVSPNEQEGQVYSLEGYVRGCSAMWTVEQNNRGLGLGLNTDPLADSNWTSIDYFLNTNASGLLLIRESGGGEISAGTYSAGDQLAITYDGSTVRYWQNGNLLRSVARPMGAALFLDSWWNQAGGKVTDVAFGPMAEHDAREGTVVATPPKEMPANARVAKLSALLSGGGAGSGEQAVRGGLWTPDGDLVAVTEEIHVPNDAPEGWYDFWFPEQLDWAAGVELSMGLHFGAPETIRWAAVPESNGFLLPMSYAATTDLPVLPAAPTLSGAAPYTVTNGISPEAEGIPRAPYQSGKLVSRSVYGGGGGDTNVAYIAYKFAKAGVYTFSFWCYMPPNWDGGDVQLNAESYTGSSGEVDVAVAYAANRGRWQRMITRVTVAGGDLEGFLIVRAPTPPSTGRSIYFAGQLIEEEQGAGLIPSNEPMIFATYATNPALPYESDLYYANLGYYSAQEKLGETEATGNHFRTKAGWHGTRIDTEPQGASLAIVDSQSPLAEELVGERIRVSHHNRSVVVFVHRATELDSGDIALSLSRRAFAALTLLSVEELAVRVEVLT